ncbi:MAG: Gfo/Idh/MocA family oxidoreductase [Armatimonadetes bacterium]|nr:Gfo/Idh/MocA family oxidoreductase [Armatimonadota bacterium]
MPEIVRWGIIGCGNIARKFAGCLSAVPGAELAAVASRELAKAESFAKDTGAARAIEGYEALVNDAGIDAVYVATPHPMHESAVRLAIAAGRPTLCEKPFAVNRASAEATIRLARERGVFLMEAMWTRFLPVSRQVSAWVAEGAIGVPHLATIDFAFRAGFNPDSRLFSPALAGGGLLDVGVYTIAYANMLFGALPTKAVGLATLGASGVDEVAGYAGRIIVPSYWNGSRATLYAEGQEAVTVDLPHDGNGFEYQAREVQRCMAAGLTESPVMPLDETLAIAGAMDDLRAQWGLRYPME